MHFCLLTIVLAVNPPLLSGTVDVDVLGAIALPPGQWVLQQSHISDDQDRTPDVFMFQRHTDSNERITILRYGGHIAPTKPVYLCDSVGDTSLFGIPFFLDRNAAQRGEGGEVHMIRKPDDWRADEIEVTYVYPDAAGTHWMSHAVLALQDKCTFVCIHCAPKVLSPEPLLNLFYESSFLSPAL